MAKAAAAKAALDALKGAALSEGAAEAKAATEAAAAHRLDVSAINEEKRALEQLAAAAKLAQVWTAWGGRNSAEAHLSDMERELNLKTLINRQEWLGFTSPQQAYAWRTNELNQRRQMNYAEWAGYQTADQYLSYLQKERSGLAYLNDVLLQRAAVYRENTDAALGYANALKGTHSSVGQLGQGIDLSGVNQFNAALQGLPDIVTTQLTIDDSAAKSEIAQYEALLKSIPQLETTVLTASQVRGAVPVGGGPVTGQRQAETIPVTFTGPYQEQFAKILADVAELNRMRAEVPVDFHIDPTEVAALKAKLGQLDVAEIVTAHLVSQGGGAGGGGGPPPVAPGAAEPPDDASAKWAALAAAMEHAGDEAAYYGFEGKAAAAATDVIAGRTAALVPKLDLASNSFRLSGSAIGFAQQHFSLFAGALGSTAFIGTVTGFHIALDAIIEALAILVPALVTATVGLAGWGAAAYQSGQQVYNQMKNVLTVSSALNTTVKPLTGNFQQLVAAVRPQVWQLFGDALDLANGKTGIFQQLIMQTGHVLDEFGARIVVDMQRGGSGLKTFFDTGEKALKGLGQLLVPLGSIFNNLIKATEKTHIAEDLLAIADALAKLLVIVTSIPTPLLALVLGLHGLSLWGGLAVSGLSRLGVALASMFGSVGPLNGVMSTLAAKLGATDDELVKLAGHAPAVKAVADAMGKNADSIAQFSVAADKSGKSVSELAAETTNGAALAEKYGSGLEKAGQDAVNLAVAAGATESQVAKVASGFAGAGAEGGFFASVLARLGGVAGLATLGLGALATAAGVFAYMALTAKDNAQQWINSINQGLASQSLFTAVGKNVSDLAAVTDQLSHSQGLNAQAVHELTGEQTALSDNLQLALPRIGQVSKEYGTSMVGALNLLNLAGVKTSDLFSRQGIVWQTDLQMVKGLIDGYQAMGQQLGTVGSDLNVLLVSESEQIKSMQTLNQAWDAWLQTVTGGESSFVKVQQDFQSIDTAQQTAGASMTGLNKQSLTLRSAFISMVPDAGKLLDAIRAQTATMEDGAQGGALLTRATKDLAAEMIPLAGNSSDARAAVLALAQEADPSITTWQKLTQWVGNKGAAGAALDLQGVLFKLATPVSDLQQDAAKLSTTLQSDLDPAMAQAEFNALGGQKAFNTFATDLQKFGPNSQLTIAAGRQVSQVLLSIDKNSSTAKNQFVAWAESMGLSKQQADALWQKVSSGQKPLESMRQGLAGSATASDNLAKSGFFAQRGDTFRTNMREMATFFGTTLPHFFTDTIPHGAAIAWDNIYQGFMRNVGSPVAKFFTATLPNFFTQTIPHAAAVAWDATYQNFMRGFGSPLAGFFTKTIPSWWNDLVSGGKQAWDNTWATFNRIILQPLSNFFTRTIPSWWNDFTADARNTWDTVWSAFNRTILQPLAGFFTRTVPGWLTDTGRFFRNLWNTVWSDFYRYDLQPLTGFFTRTVPGWLDSIGRFFKSTWQNVWKDFSNDVVGPMGRWFSQTLPNAIHNGFRDAINWVIDNVINKVINFINNDILKHLPGSLHISTIGNVAHGGPLGAAYGGPFPRMAPGSVPGASAVDGTRIMAMGGEYMVRQPARMALEQAYGRGFMDRLNQADSWLGSGSRGTPASQATQTGVNTGPSQLQAARALPFPARQFATGGQIVAEAEHFIGAPYVFGGTSPSGWDCSGFVQYVLEHLGWHNVPRTSEQQYSWTSHTSNPSIGGLVFAQFPGDGPSPGHVGFYVGNGQVLSARDPQLGTGIDNLSSWAGHIVGFGNEPNATGLIGQIISGIGGFISEAWQSVEGLLDSAGNGLGSLVKPLAGLVSGGAGELLKLAREGAAAIFNGVWDHSVSPLLGVVPGDTIPGAILQGSASEIKQAIDNFMTGQDSSAKASAAAATSGSGAIGPVSGPADAGPGQAENYAKGRLSAFGWGQSQWPPLQSLWERESGWSRFADNRSSGAYGIPQALPYTKLPIAGQPGGGSHASPQIDWGLNYIKTRIGYGSPAAAWAHEVSQGWYPFGGVIGPPAEMFTASGGLLAAPVLAAGGLTDWPPLYGDIRNEMSAMDAIQHAHLPAKGPTAAQRSAFAAWQKALWTQQLRTIGLGRRPPGAFGALYSSAGSPGRMTAAQWQAFTGNLKYLLRESEGPGIPGGINPPGTPKNSGFWAFKYLKPQWQGLLDRLRIANTQAGAAERQWGSMFSTAGLGGGSTGTDSPEWDAASAALTTAVRTEMQWMNTMQHAHLPARGPTMMQRHAYTDWLRALWSQQLKTVGLGHRPPGAFQVITDRLGAPGTITSAQWSAFQHDLTYLTREVEGTGVSGGINPPGTPKNSGYAPWKWLHGDWQTLLHTLRNASSKAAAARTVWGTLYGPGHVPYTPGPGKPPPAVQLPGLVNVMPEATIGGPGMPVFDVAPSGASMGFAAGGGLDQVAGLFSGGLNPGGVMLPLIARHGIPDSVLRQLSGASGGSSSREFPRRVSEAGGAHYGPALNVEQLNIHNPLPQRPSDSIAHAGNRLAFLAGRMS